MSGRWFLQNTPCKNMSNQEQFRSSFVSQNQVPLPFCVRTLFTKLIEARQTIINLIHQIDTLDSTYVDHNLITSISAISTQVSHLQKAILKIHSEDLQSITIVPNKVTQEDDCDVNIYDCTHGRIDRITAEMVPFILTNISFFDGEIDNSKLSDEKNKDGQAKSKNDPLDNFLSEVASYRVSIEKYIRSSKLKSSSSSLRDISSVQQESLELVGNLVLGAWNTEDSGDKKDIIMSE
ncbi:hypothetical protein GJ496_000371 [Pomphorhynchus laevis]|nr:hypothetical protein GJ496_000371 [Pomphorhynchus laevis]